MFLASLKSIFGSSEPLRPRRGHWNLIFKSEAGALRLIRDEGPEDPETLALDGRVYRDLVPNEFGPFWNASVDREGRVVGIELDMLSNEQVVRSRFVTSTRGVEAEFHRTTCEYYSLSIDLSPEVSEREYEFIEGFPVKFYGDDGGDVIVFIGIVGGWIGEPGRFAIGPDASWRHHTTITAG